MFCLFVVLVKLSVLANWLARKTPLRKLNRGEGIVSTKPRPKCVIFFGLVYCFVVFWCFCCPSAVRDTFHLMARYSLFVLKVLLNTNQLTILTYLGISWWNCRYKTCKAPVKSSPPTNQHPVFYRLDVLPVTQPTVSEHWRGNITFQGLAHPKLTFGAFQLCLWPLKAPSYLGEGCHASHQPSDANTPSEMRAYLQNKIFHCTLTVLLHYLTKFFTKYHFLYIFKESTEHMSKPVM